MSKTNLSKNKDTVKSSADQNALKKLKVSLGIIIAAVAFILYAQSISFEYTLDDEYVVTHNKVVQDGIAAFPTILSTDYFFGYKRINLRGPVYRPVPLLLFATEWQLFPNNPYIAHLINVLLYALLCWLLFLLLTKLFEKHSSTNRILFLMIPFVCTLFYVVHPIHTEVVDSVKSGDELLCFIFGIISILMAIRFINTNDLKDLAIAAFSYLVALLSKETGIVFLMITPLILFVFNIAGFKRIISITGALILASGIFFLIRYFVLQSIPPNEFLKYNNSIASAPDFISQRATAFYVMLRYLWLLVIPHPLAYDYSNYQIPNYSIKDMLPIISIIIHFSIGIFAIINIRKRSILAFAILFYLITLAPVSNIFMLIGSPMAERFLFIPSFGYCLAITLLLIKITKADKHSVSSISKQVSLGNFFNHNTTLYIIVFIIAGAYSIKTFSRSMDWESNVTLHGHDVEVSPNSSRMHYNWGGTLLNTLAPKATVKEEQNRILDRAIVEFTKAVDILQKPYPDATMAIGYCYYKKEDYQNAIKYYEIARQQFQYPNVDLLNNLACTYGALEQYDKAIDLTEKAIKLDSNYVMPHLNRGLYLLNTRRFKEAIPEYEKVIELNPDIIKAYQNLSIIYTQLGDAAKAKMYKEMAERINKDQ